MSHSPDIQTDVKLRAAFAECAAAKPKTSPPKPPAKRSVTVAFRVTEEEHALLQQAAGSLALSNYIRQCTLGDKAAPSKKRHAKKKRQPTINSTIVAKWLGMLGQSELARSMMALAMAAQSGSLPVTDELEEKLHRSCDDIHDMRVAFITTLGIKAKNGR